MKLARLGSSQSNESLNNNIGSDKHKICHYDASKSNEFHVVYAVNQKNIGHSYIAEVGNIDFTSLS